MLEITRATKADIERVRSLEIGAFGFTWDAATFAKELCRENGATVVARAGGEVVGSALLVWAAGEVQLNSIVLAPNLRGQGLSKSFLGCLMKWSRQQGFSWYTLEVKWNNPPAHKLYRDLGFVTTACRTQYYSDGQDARIMWAGHLQSYYFEELLKPHRLPDQDLRRSA